MTVPKELRDRLGLEPGSEVEFTASGDGVLLRKASGPSRRGAELVAHLRGRGTVPVSTEEIMALTRDE